MIRNYLTSLNVCFCGEDTCVKGHSFGPAIRPYYLMHAILSGKGNFQKNGKTWALETGDVFLIRPGEITYYEADTEEPWHYVWVAFQGNDAEALVEQDSQFTNNSVVHISNESQASFFHDFLDLKKRFKDPHHQSLELLGGFFQLMSFMLKNSNNPEPQQTEYIFQAKEYMIQNFNNVVRIQDIADYIGLNRSYLYKLFIEKEGCSPKQYLTNYQMDVAKSMLSERTYNITNVAHLCGFYDASSFCNQFKKHFGLSPKDYLRSLEQ